jgi:hypothetical protein
LAAGVAALSGAVCGELAAGVAALGGAVRGELAAGVAALAGAACGELAGDAETRRLSGALISGEGDEAIMEGVVALIAGEGGETIGETIVESVVLRLRGTLAISDLASPSWPAICTTTPLAVAIEPHTSAAEAAANGRDCCMMPPIQPPLPADPGKGPHYWSRWERKGSMAHQEDLFLNS